ncbi:MAG: hypothetical protein ACK5NA_11605 [Enterococcus sp.]
MKKSDTQLIKWLFATHSDAVIASGANLPPEKINYIHKIFSTNSDEIVEFADRHKLAQFAIFRMAIESTKFQEAFRSALRKSIDVSGTLNDSSIQLSAKADDQRIAFTIEADKNENVMETLVKDYTLNLDHCVNPVRIHPKTDRTTLFTPGEFAKAYKRIAASLNYAFNAAKLTLPLV